MGTTAGPDGRMAIIHERESRMGSIIVQRVKHRDIPIAIGILAAEEGWISVEVVLQIQLALCEWSG